MDLAKSINKESQGVMKIATNVAEACTDKTMKKVLHLVVYAMWMQVMLHVVTGKAVLEVVEKMQTISHQLRILAAGEAARKRGSNLVIVTL